jgi:hypothetical protein
MPTLRRVLLGRDCPTGSIGAFHSSKKEAVRARNYGLLVDEVEATAPTQAELPRRIIMDLANCAAAPDSGGNLELLLKVH